MSIKDLKELLVKYNIFGYLIPTTDEYLSEYTPNYAKRLEYITGFSGSNGIALICQEKSLVFTDGRYLEQAFKQLDPDIYEVHDITRMSQFPWDKYLSPTSQIGYDSKLFTTNILKYFSKLTLIPISNNLVDLVWKDRPAKPDSPIYLYDEKYAGESHTQKIMHCREFMSQRNIENLVITSSSAVCWLLNLRASDVEFSPLLLANIILTKDKLYLFVEPNRIGNDIKLARLEVTFLANTDFEQIASNLVGKIGIDENLASQFVLSLFEGKEVLNLQDYCGLMKSKKNHIELELAKSGHIKDAVALCEFLAYIDNADNAQDLSEKTEYELGEVLTTYRALQDGYVMDSFPAIIGYQANGAIIHYRAEKNLAKKITGSGLLLIDSGGHYLGTTTDVTRTIAIGEPSREQITRYTQVLKGHIALASLKFPFGMYGNNLDAFARQYLWEDYLNYPHSTGHGVGSFLSVHEFPPSISLAQKSYILAPSMIVSNEPGYYKSGEYGIRIENLLQVKQSQNSNFLEFENLTLVPYASELIDMNALITKEKEYLSSYYKSICQNVEPLLSSTAKQWLHKQIDKFL